MKTMTIRNIPDDVAAGLTADARDSFGNAGNCRPAYRQQKGPQYRESYVGFRVVCPADFH